MATTQAEIESKGPDLWMVRATRELNGVSATCSVLLRQHEKPSTSAPPHEKLAGSNAWLALGEKLVEADDLTGAITCARKGLDELGRKYTPAGVEDDTEMAMLYATNQIGQGRLKDGAQRLLGTLKNRISLYQELHAASLGQA